MKKLINEIINMIENQMKVPGRTYLLKLEDFDTPVIYMEICKHFSSIRSLRFIANLEYSKYTYFKDKNKPEWVPALEYLSDNGYAKNELSFQQVVKYPPPPTTPHDAKSIVKQLKKELTEIARIKEIK